MHEHSRPRSCGVAKTQPRFITPRFSSLTCSRYINTTKPQRQYSNLLFPRHTTTSRRSINTPAACKCARSDAPNLTTRRLLHELLVPVARAVLLVRVPVLRVGPHAPLGPQHEVGVARRLVRQHLGRLVPRDGETEAALRCRHGVREEADLLQRARLVPGISSLPRTAAVCVARAALQDSALRDPALAALTTKCARGTAGRRGC